MMFSPKIGPRIMFIFGATAASRFNLMGSDRHCLNSDFFLPAGLNGDYLRVFFMFFSIQNKISKNMVRRVLY